MPGGDGKDVVDGEKELVQGTARAPIYSVLQQVVTGRAAYDLASSGIYSDRDLLLETRLSGQQSVHGFRGYQRTARVPDACGSHRPILRMRHSAAKGTPAA